MQNGENACKNIFKNMYNICNEYNGKLESAYKTSQSL